MSEISNMKSCEKKEVILEYLDVCDDKEVIVMKRTFIPECTLSIAGTFHGVHERKRVEQIWRKTCSKNQSGKKADVLFFTIPWSEHPNSNTEGMGGLYREELRNYTGLGRIKSDSISPEKKPQRSRNCGQAISTERAESGKGKKVLEK